jgi:hypothetical protein
VLLFPVYTVGFTVLRLGVGRLDTVSRPSRIDDVFFQRALMLYDILRIGSGRDTGSHISAYLRPLGFTCGVALQLVFLVSCVCLAALIAVATRGLTQNGMARAVVHRWIPLASVAVWLVGWWIVNNGLFFPYAFWLWCFYSPSTGAAILAAALLVVGGAIVANRILSRKPVTLTAVLTLAAFTLLSLGFWFVTMVGGRILWLPLALLSAATASRVVLWLYQGPEAAGYSSDNLQQDNGRTGRWFLPLVALASLLILVAIWIPPMPYSIAHARDITSLTIRLSRVGGQGLSPAYSITISGDGSVTYLGKSMVGIRGLQKTSIRPDEVRKLAGRLDRIGFWGLDSRVFLSCAHGSVATILVSVDGRDKIVVGSSCWGLDREAGPLKDVLRMAQDIDRTVGSDRWTRCDPPCFR